jgi:hypothetical protein
MTIEYNYLSEFMVFNSMITTPPPSTVSIVLHKIFGVTDSKSYKTKS